MNRLISAKLTLAAVLLSLACGSPEDDPSKDIQSNGLQGIEGSGLQGIQGTGLQSVARSALAPTVLDTKLNAELRVQASSRTAR